MNLNDMTLEQIRTTANNEWRRLREEIRSLRQKTGLSQQAMATLLDWPVKSLRDLELGRGRYAEPPTELLMAVALGLELEIVERPKPPPKRYRFGLLDLLLVYGEIQA